MKDMFVQTVMMFSQSGQINSQYYKLVNELEALKRRVKKLDGKNVFFVHQPFNPSTATMIIRSRSSPNSNRSHVYEAKSLQ